MSNTPLTKYRYRRRLPHLQKADCDLFITFCALRGQILPEAARELILAHSIREPGKRIRLHAVVVMPDHVHLLCFPLRDPNGWPYPMVDILQCLKSTTAHRINKLLHRCGPLWEDESFDHVLRSDESLREKCEYIRQNPVRRGLVARPEEYRWLWVSPELSESCSG
jgi:REP element-mobilizing transposase RayT